MSLGDLTIQGLLRRRKVAVKGNMTVSDFIAAVQKLGPYLVLIPGLAALMAALGVLNALLNAVVALYAEAVKLYEEIKKAISIATGLLTGNPNSANDAAKEGQKSAVNSAKSAITSQYDALKTKVLVTPLSTLSGGAIP